jgi:hypothetical protein
MTHRTHVALLIGAAAPMALLATNPCSIASWCHASGAICSSFAPAFSPGRERRSVEAQASHVT